MLSPRCLNPLRHLALSSSSSAPCGRAPPPLPSRSHTPPLPSSPARSGGSGPHGTRFDGFLARRAITAAASHSATPALHRAAASAATSPLNTPMAARIRGSHHLPSPTFDRAAGTATFGAQATSARCGRRRGGGACGRLKEERRRAASGGRRRGGGACGRQEEAWRRGLWPVEGGAAEGGGRREEARRLGLRAVEGGAA
ncbi:hypothetical protein ACP70R_028202 [Stipagrostis hirtigluma subsp. patula]